MNNLIVESGGFFFFQAEDGIRDLVRSRGLGDVYKRQVERAGQVLPEQVLHDVGRVGADHDELAVRHVDDLSLIHI